MAGLAEIQTAERALAGQLSALSGSVAATQATIARLADERLTPATGDALVTQLNDSANTIASLQAQLDAANASAPA